MRWLKLFPGRRLDEYLGQPTENDIQSLAADRGVIRCHPSICLTWFEHP